MSDSPDVKTVRGASLYGQPAIHDLLHFGWSADLAHYEALATEVRREGAACVLVTHSTAAAARADRALRLTSTGLVPA